MVRSYEIIQFYIHSTKLTYGRLFLDLKRKPKRRHGSEYDVYLIISLSINNIY